MKTRSNGFLLPALFAAVLSTAAVASAQDCLRGQRPAATLLVPYFEVDLENVSGRRTLFSVRNTSSDGVLVRAVLWTNWGLPSLAFDVYVGGRGTRSVDLRDVFMDGELPVTGPPSNLVDPATFPGCTSPLTNPQLDAEALTVLRAKHLGVANPEDDLCYSSAVEDGLVTGYVTIDVLNDCSQEIRYPGDSGYFVAGGQGLANNRNLLTGDFFLVNPDDASAQGLQSVAVVADAEVFAGEGPLPYSFYETAGDQRLPLSSVHQARFLNGGAFDGGTDLIVWQSGLDLPPAECGFVGSPGAVDHFLFFVNEASDAVEEADLSFLESSWRVTVGGEDLPLEMRFGTVEIRSTRTECVICGVPTPTERMQTWVASLMRAAGRFSVGYPAVRIDDLCSP